MVMPKEARTYLYRGGILLLSTLGVLMVLMRQTNYGVGLMVDSLTHTSTAESLLRGEGFVTAWNSRPQQGQPPLYALWLSLFATLDAVDKNSVFEYAGQAGAIIFGLTILASVAWIAVRVRSRIIVIIGGAICAVSPFLGDLFSLALTETLFTLVTVISLLTLDKFLTVNKRSLLILAATFSSLAWLTRHIGVTVIVSSILVLATRGGLTLRQRLNSIAVYSSISILPSSLWMFRNYIVLGQFSERRWSTGFDWITSLNLTSSEVTKWLMGTTGLNYLNRLSRTLGIDVTLFRIIVLGLMVSFTVSGFIHLYRKGIRVDTKDLIVPTSFIVVYSVALIASLIVTDIDVDVRYLSPVYVPILVVVTRVIGRYISSISQANQSTIIPSHAQQTHKERSKLRFIMIACLSLPLALTTFSSCDQIRIWREQGFGYSSANWSDSETISYLKSNPINGRIYSNEARAVYIHMDTSDELEVHFIQLQAELPDEARYWDDRARDDDLEMYVIWFHGWRPFIQTQYDFTRLISLLNLEIVATLEDGVVLKVSQNFDSSSRIVDSEDAEYLMLHALLEGSHLIVRSEFDIYLADTRLIYTRDSCNGANTDDPFFLHIFPTNSTDVDYPNTSNFNNHDFRFNREGFSFGERCAVIRNLPSYAIEMIRTGQFSTETELWKESFNPEDS